MTEDTQTPADGLKGWLDTLDLGQYHDAMAQEDITLATILELDDADFRELGISMGHRKVLKRAIAALRDASDQGTADEPAQRRQLTVLFCDLAQSTKMAQRYDAEDLASILRRYHDRCHQIIKSWGGRLLGTQGDGVIACFGLPRAQENDAERCVRAALEMSQAIRELEFEDGLILHSRIGVATGRLYVHGNPEEPGNVVGDTLNLASRLQDCAATDSVVLGNVTRRLVKKVALLEPLGQRELKGFADPVDIWTVTGMQTHQDRLSDETSGQGLVGREIEIDRLHQLWQEAKTGKGQVAVLSGEAGIGKSAILDAVRAFVTDDDHIHVRYFCAPFYENSGMFPIIAQLNHAAGIQDSDPSEVRLDKLRQMMQGADDKPVQLIAELLSIDTGSSFAPLDMTAAQQKLETFAALQAMLVSQASEHPVLILVEDTHWADPTSLEFLTAAVGQVIAENPVLLVVTHRPTITLGWDAHPHVTPLNLDRLSEAQSRDIILRVMGDQTCPIEVVHDIIENADGVPLFVEELARSAMEQIRQDGFRRVKLPSSLEDSLRGRLDRLSLGKSVVQTAAVFGRRFYMSLLKPLLGMQPQQLSLAVQEPVDANIILPLDSSNDETMLFRHALVQQSAYQGLLRTQRKTLHARIAELLLEHRPGLAETEPETLARHFAGSGQLEEAITYLTAAGQRAASRAGQIEATNHYQAALDLLAQLPASRERDTQEVLLQALLGGALMATRGFAAPDVYDAFARARELCIELGDNPMYCACLYGLFTVNASRSNKAEAIALSEEMLTTFGAAPVPSWAIAAQFSAGVASFFLGQLETAQSHFEEAVALYTEDQHGPLVEQFGDNLAEFSMCYLQWLHLAKGQIDLSEDYLGRAEKLANDLNNKNGQTRSFSFRMGRLQELGEVAKVAELAPQVINLSMTQGYPYWATAGQIGLGWAMSLSGKPEGVDMINTGLGFFDMIGQKTPQMYWRCYLVAALIANGQKDDALKAADEALAPLESGLDRFYAGQALCLKGQAHLMDPAAPEEAETCFRDGMALAQQTGAHLHVLNCALGLAGLLRAQDRDEDAVTALTGAIVNISAREDFPTLTRARALLAELTG